MFFNHLILCHPLLSSVFPAAGSFPMSHFFTPGGQTIGASVLASVFSMNSQGWFPLGLTCWSPCSPRDSEEASPASQFKSIIQCSAFFTVQLSHLYMITGKTIALTRRKAITNLDNMLKIRDITLLTKVYIVSWVSYCYGGKNLNELFGQSNI